MRSQRIGQGFESPRLHQNPKDTAKSVSFGFLRSRQGSDPRVLGTLSVKENICSNATRSEMKDPRAGSAAAAADAFARAVARAERPACKSISPVRHLPLWRSSPRHDLPRHRKVGVLRIFAQASGERTSAQHFTCACLFALFSCIRASDLSVRAGSAAAAADAFALPHHPGHVRHPSQTHPIFISLPLWRQGIYSMADPVHIIAVRHCKERGSGVSYIKHAGRVRACERG